MAVPNYTNAYSGPFASPMPWGQNTGFNSAVNVVPMGMQQPRIPTMPSNAIRGYIVHAESDILAQDVPMDGTMAFFPLSDGSGIIGKCWNSNGTIDTIFYNRLGPTVSPEDAGPTFEDQVMGKLDDILNSLRHNGRKNPQQRQSNKENSNA